MTTRHWWRQEVAPYYWHTLCHNGLGAAGCLQKRQMYNGHQNQSVPSSHREMRCTLHSCLYFPYCCLNPSFNNVRWVELNVLQMWLFGFKKAGHLVLSAMEQNVHTGATQYALVWKYVKHETSKGNYNQQKWLWPAMTAIVGKCNYSTANRIFFYKYIFTNKYSTTT